MGMAFGGVSKKVVATNIVAADGSGDYTDIQTAINDLPADGGVVYIKEGTYEISTTITVNKPNVSIVGSGRSTIVSYTAYSRLIYLGREDCTIEKIMFKGDDRSGQEVGIAGTRCVVKDCWIENCEYGINIPSGSRFILEGNYIKSCIDDGIKLGLMTEDVDESIIKGNIIVSNEDNGINLVGGNRNVITGNLTISNGTDGIEIGSNSTDALVHGNMSYNNSASAIDDNGTTSTLADNKTP